MIGGNTNPETLNALTFFIPLKAYTAKYARFEP